MWKQISRSRFIITPKNVRFFLSEAYKCTDAWNARLQLPILTKIRPDNFYYDLDTKYQRSGKICAIDLDILANSISDNKLLDELSDLVHKLRLTADTQYTLPSTSHAVVRHHLDFGGDNELANLIYILDDRLSYGVFLDSFSANLCLDKMIRAENYRMAAKVATFLMLQEDFTNAINRALSLYACFKYLQDPQSFDDLVKNQATDEELATEIHAALQEKDPKAKKAKKRTQKEEIRVRINYIRNQYFDDHFDLRNSLHLVGKTLVTISRHMDDAIGHSIRLLGYCFYEKYSDGCRMIESIGENTNQLLYRDAVEMVKNKIAEVKDRDNDESFKKFMTLIDKQLNSTNSLKTEPFEEAIKQFVEKTVSEHESTEIQEQIKIYELWNQMRETRLKEELLRAEQHARLQKIDTMLDEMTAKEEKLWFFENELKIDLELEKLESDRVEVKAKKLSRTQRKQVEDAYVPPEVDRKRN